MYQLSLEARRHLNRWFHAHQLEALRPSTPSVISAMLGKTSGNALRVAGMLHLVWNKDDPGLEISLDHIRFATVMVDQCIAETREFHQPPDTIGTVMMRHVHSLSWDNDRVQDELITWQIAKDNGNQPIRNGGAKGFKKPSRLWRSRFWVNVYRWARCGRSKRPSHGRRHSGQRWTWGVSGAIAVLSWALRRFRQMDTVPRSLKLQVTPPWGGASRSMSSCPNRLRATAPHEI